MKLHKFLALFHIVADVAEQYNNKSTADGARCIMWNQDTVSATSFGVFVRVTREGDWIGFKKINADGIGEGDYIVIPRQAIPELINTISAVMLRLPIPTEPIEIKLKD